MKKIKWKYSLQGVRGVTQRSPVFFNDLVLITLNHGMGSNFKGTLAAVDIDSGKEIWKFDTDHYLNEPAISEDGYIFISCFNGFVYKLDANGELCWEQQPERRNLWRGLVLGNKFIYPEIAGGSRLIRALDTDSGSVCWENDVGGHSYSLATDGNVIVNISTQGSFENTKIFLNCINAESGKTRWKIETDHYLFRPLIIEDLIILGGSGVMSLFSLDTGKQLKDKHYDQSIKFSAHPIETPNGIIFTGESGDVYRIDLTQSKKLFSRSNKYEVTEKWHVNLGAEINAEARVYGSSLLIVTEDGQLHTIDTSTGQSTDSYKIPEFKKGYGVNINNEDTIIAASNKCICV